MINTKERKKELPLISLSGDEFLPIRIRQATTLGYIDMISGGVVDLSYPNSSTRRGRVQENGEVSGTITTNVETGLYRIEFYEED